MCPHVDEPQSRGQSGIPDAYPCIFLRSTLVNTRSLQANLSPAETTACVQQHADANYTRSQQALPQQTSNGRSFDS